jgi:lipoprotein-releasing system permease protein
MFKPLSLYIGLRYIRAKRRNRFVSFISLVSMLGIALGVLVLITVLSVMNGFDQQIQLKLFSMAPHITVSGIGGTLHDWQTVAKKTAAILDVIASSPYVNGQGLLTIDNDVKPVVVQGILPQYEKNITTLQQKTVNGSFSKLKAGQFNIVLGDGLANSLGVIVGDKINLMIPKTSITPIGILPRFKRFTVAGIFHVGAGFGFDTGYAFINLQDAQKLFGLGDQVSGIQLKIKDLFDAPQLSLTIQRKLGFEYQIANWTDLYGEFYHAVKMEKTIMFFILLLLIAIAAFNLVAGLVMLVNAKKADIAILRTFGATPRTIMNIFIFQGLIVGFTGTLLGVIGGVLLSLNVTRLVDFLQNLFHVVLFTPNVYWVDFLPSQLQLSDVWEICIIALLMSLIATIYPAWSAARTKPVEALRYE